MSKWNEDYQNKVETLDFFFQRLYPTWVDIDIDFTKERPKSLDGLHNALNELIDALTDFAYEVEDINEND